ncbi:MAG: SpaA isopeptide-forming pilin-related protein [Bacteroidales bacterium]|nr:SpaA isopeptide-forming pilin-related protein [Clostridium sp.]MCM1204710.1 SpaA isopeptide-forming pilin-related protein [Bacteroidales bacterium]
MKKQRFRGILAIMLAFSLILPYVPYTKAFAAIAADFISSEQTTQCTEEISTSQPTSSIKTEEAASTADSSQTTMEEFTTEKRTDYTTDNTAEIPEYYFPKLFPDETTTAKSNAEKPAELWQEELNIAEEEIVEEEVLDSKLASGSTVLSAGSWGGGYYWYIMQNAPLYVFCLDHGMTMYSGKYSFVEKWDTLYDSQTTFRMAVAMDYFKKNGGLYSLAGYEDAQRAIWGIGGTPMANQLMEYADNLWQLTEINPFRTGGANSYKNITAVRQQDISSRDSRKQLYQSELFNKKVQLNKNEGAYDVNNRSLSVGGAAWKYFAAKAPNGWGALSIVGCYSNSGQKLSSQNAEASIGTDGKLKVSFNQKEGSFGTAEAPVMIVVKADLGLQGAVKINYLDSGTGKQRMSYDVSASSPAYFALKVYASGSTDEQGVVVNIHKVDGLNQAIDGAVFTLTGTDSTGKTVYPAQRITTSADGGNTFRKIEEEGTYILEETSPPPGMKNSGIKIKLKAIKTDTATGSKIVLSTVGTLPPYVKQNKNADNIEFTYTVTNEYESGSACLQKQGNVFVDYADGEFIYEKRSLDKVFFDLYTNEDIYLGDTLLWKANTKLTQDVLDASIWNKNLNHGAAIDTFTDSNGELHYYHLPLGKYYLIETSNTHNTLLPIYHVWNTRLPFEIKANENNLIMGGKYINKAVPANCFVEKIDKAEGLPLQGAEFTLYAHIKNTNFDGYPLFTTADTTPAVTARDQKGQETVEENTWIPLKTVISDEKGMAEFGLELPYGQYMVVETNPPEGYSFSAEDSYIFTHKLELNNTYPNGANYTHIFENEKSSNMIVIKKYGELITGAEIVVTDYGDYQELMREKQPVEDVIFEIYDEYGILVETLKTDECGIAKSGNLTAPAIYTVKEVDNGGTLQLETKAKTVVLEENKTASTQIKEIEFVNHALSTELKIYKQAEIPSLSPEMPEGVSKSDKVYIYEKKPIEGVVFGVYTYSEIADYQGNIILAKDSCVGYAVTDTEGIAVFNKKLCNGRYYYREIQTADETYIPDSHTYDFDITLNGIDFVAELNKDTPIVNQKYKGSIKIIKKSGEEDICLKGVSFNLLDAGKNLIGCFITDSHGEIHINNLPVGIYYLQETKTRKNYILDNTMRKINLTGTNLSPEMEILNYKKVKDKEPGNGKDIINGNNKNTTTGSVRTGDLLTWIIWGIFTLAITILFVWHYYKQTNRKAGIQRK